MPSKTLDAPEPRWHLADIDRTAAGYDARP
jgi:hypothetical protein